MTIQTSTSIIIPSYNEGARIGKLLADFEQLLQHEPHVSVLVVDDGSRQDHLREVEQLVLQAQQKNSRISLFKKPKNGGKGSAIAAGFAQVSSDVVGFVDADGSVSAAESLRVIKSLDQNHQVSGVIGSRVKMLGQNVERKLSRHLVGRVFATIVSMMFDIPVYDSQCGCKFFRRSAVQRLLPSITSQTWTWDTQLVILAYRAGLNIVECPVSWSEVPGSKVSMLTDPIKMLLQLLDFKKSLEPAEHKSTCCS